MNNMRNKILMTLVALFTMTAGAWADPNILAPTITGDREFYESVEVTMICTSPNADIYYTVNGKDPRTLPDNQQIEYGNPITLTETTTIMARAFDGNDWSAMVEVTFTKLTGPKVTWDAATKTGTFEMPAYDVEIAPEYAPVAKWATKGDAVLAPTAIEGIFAGTTDAIVKAGTVVEGQGTAMYFATTDATMTAEKAAAADGWLSTLPTAAGYDGATTVYVWYYIKGADTPDGQEASAENTFNDLEICATPLKVEVLSNKFDIQFNAANANTIESGKATVKVGDAAVEVKEGKLTGVKMGSKVTITAKEGYKFRKAEAKKTGSAVLAPALENGATVVIICNWGYAATTFTYTNNGGTFSGQASGYDANYFNNGLELNGKNLSFGAWNEDLPDYLSVGITFNTESSAYSYTGKGEYFASFTISVNGTDVTDQLSELK